MLVTRLKSSYCAITKLTRVTMLMSTCFTIILVFAIILLFFNCLYFSFFVYDAKLLTLILQSFNSSIFHSSLLRRIYQKCDRNGNACHNCRKSSSILPHPSSPTVSICISYHTFLPPSLLSTEDCTRARCYKSSDFRENSTDTPWLLLLKWHLLYKFSRKFVGYVPLIGAACLLPLLQDSIATHGNSLQ